MLTPWKKSYDQLDSICLAKLIQCLRFKNKIKLKIQKTKNRDITFLTKVLLVKAMVFPVVMYGCESWTIKKAEHQIIDAFLNGNVGEDS